MLKDLDVGTDATALSLQGRGVSTVPINFGDMLDLKLILMRTVGP